jgi:hypothetical protein
LKVVLESEVVILDPHFTTAAITRTFGYHVYDTLFAMDDRGQIKPQMVDHFASSADAEVDLPTARWLALAHRWARDRKRLCGLAQADAPVVMPQVSGSISQTAAKVGAGHLAGRLRRRLSR